MHSCLLNLILVARFAAAQSTAIPEQKKTRLEGRALSTAGEAVRKANIRLIGSGQNGQPPSIYTESTDNDGKFLFEDVAPGRYTLTAEKPGFVSGRYGARSTNSPGTQISVSAGQEMKDLVFLLTPQGVITGRVTEQDGDPVRGVQVNVLRAGYNRGRRQLLPSGGTSTDDLGNFRAGSLAPGRYYLSATDRSAGFVMGLNEKPGHAAATPPEGNVTTYYPQAVDVQSAAAIDVTAGAELAGFNIRLRKARTYSIRGKAVDTTTGAPAKNAMLSAVPKPDAAAGAMMLVINRAVQQARPPDGAFEFRNLTPGTYILQNLPGGNINGNPLTPLTGRVEVTIADMNVEGVVLPLGPGVEIAGTMRLEDGDLQSLLSSQKPNQGAAQAIGAAGGLPVPIGISANGAPALLLQEAENLGFGAPNARLKEDGTFKLQPPAAAKYFLNVAALPDGTYVKSIRFGNQDVTHDVLDLTSSGGGTLDILLSPKAADVSGVVQDAKGEAIGGVQVTVWPKTPERGSANSGIRTASTDQNGSFKLSGLAPGDYFAAAWDDPEPGLTQSPEFLAKFNNDAAAAKLGESAHETVSLKMIGRDRIAAEAAKLP